MCSIIIAFSISTANQFCNQQDSCKALLISYSDSGNSDYFHLIINSGMYARTYTSSVILNGMIRICICMHIHMSFCVIKSNYN